MKEISEENLTLVFSREVDARGANVAVTVAYIVQAFDAIDELESQV